MCSYIPLELEKYYESMLSKVEKRYKTIIRNIANFSLQLYCLLANYMENKKNKIEFFSVVYLGSNGIIITQGLHPLTAN